MKYQKSMKPPYFMKYQKYKVIESYRFTKI